jgi:hypothetical protein
MFAAYGKMFALAEKCLRPMEKCSPLLRNVCGLKNGAKRGKIRNQKT